MDNYQHSSGSSHLDNVWNCLGSYRFNFLSAHICVLGSVFLLLGLVILAGILPGKFLREKFVGKGSLASLIAKLGMIVARHYGSELGVWLVRDFGKYLLLLMGFLNELLPHFGYPDYHAFVMKICGNELIIPIRNLDHIQKLFWLDTYKTSHKVRNIMDTWSQFINTSLGHRDILS